MADPVDCIQTAGEMQSEILRSFFYDGAIFSTVILGNMVVKIGQEVAKQDFRFEAYHSFYDGVPGGIRTPNLLIRSQKLYPVELQAPSKIFDFQFLIGMPA